MLMLSQSGLMTLKSTASCFRREKKVRCNKRLLTMPLILFRSICKLSAFPLGRMTQRELFFCRFLMWAAFNGSIMIGFLYLTQQSLIEWRQKSDAQALENLESLWKARIELFQKEVIDS